MALRGGVGKQAEPVEEDESLSLLMFHFETNPVVLKGGNVLSPRPS